MIAPALEAMRAFDQWILHRPDKTPIDWRTMAPGNPHDPAGWLPYDQAEVLADLCGLGIGFVLTEGDPFYLLDIDKCASGGAWSPLAVSVCTRLAGAAVEVSISGQGLHVIGCAIMAPHACRSPLGMELYHTGRYVALGRRPGSTGDAAHDSTLALAGIIAEYFPPSAPAAGAPDDWTDEPREGAGIADDDALLRAASASQSAANAFGGAAGFTDLWTADADALGRSYPDGSGPRPYDASQADAALAARLYFWTGGNCERTRALMMRSALYREKWGREDYLQRTISMVHRRGGDVYRPRPVDAPVATVTAAPMSLEAAGRPVNGRTILGIDDQRALFDGCCYIEDAHKIFCSGDGALLGPEQFSARHGGYQFVMDPENGKLETNAWTAFLQSRLYRWPRVRQGVFRPDLKPGAIWQQAGMTVVNTYVPIHTPRVKGDAGPFLDYMARAYPVERDRRILLAYFAALVQYPGVKFQWTVLLQGVEGNGKTFLNTCLREAVGVTYWYSPKAAELAGKFNDWLDRRLLVTVEDVHVPSHKSDVLEALKPMITGDYLELEGKGEARRTSAVCANFILNSNHKDAITKTRRDRRFAVFYGGQQEESDLLRDGLTEAYFGRLYSWARAGGYAVINDYLRSYAIPDELNPATACTRAPRTSSTEDAILASMGTVEQEIQEAIDQEQVGFRGGWASSHYLDMLLDRGGYSRSIPRAKRRGIMQGLGYDWHPGLDRGRVHNPVNPDGPGLKPVLYVRLGSEAAALKGAAAVRAYESAQQDSPAASVFGKRA